MAPRRIFASLVVLTVLWTAAPGRSEEPSPAASTLTVELINLNREAGESRGQGVLRFAGKEYPCQITGLRVENVNSITTAVVGNVYNLQKASDLAGTYTPAQTSVTLTGTELAGANVITVQNRHNVLIYLFPQESAALKVDPRGFTINMP